MSKSRQEEIISALWAIAAILAFAHEFTYWGWAFAVKAVLDTACSVYFSFNEIQAERKLQ